MQRKRHSSDVRSRTATWLAGSLVVVYSVSFLAFLYVSWFRPERASWALLLERCLTILTPLVAVILQYYMRPRQHTGDDDNR